MKKDSTKAKILLAQLPVPRPAALAASGNVPLAAGCLAVAAKVHGLLPQLDVQVMPPQQADSLGDRRMADAICAASPEFLGLSLYCWNIERSLFLARQIKQRAPHTRIIVGGPEVTPDNALLTEAHCVDHAVAGEGEQAFVRLLQKLLQARGPTLRRMPAPAIDGNGDAKPENARTNWPLATYPSPYATGALAVEPDCSVYVETVRGCRSRCTFCSYPRHRMGLRSLSVADSLALIRQVRDLGGREIVFVDPTFNQRPEFDDLLTGLKELNADGFLSFFAEVRAESLSKKQVQDLAAAHFASVEVGLQTVNKKSLALLGRGGNPEKVLRVAKQLKNHGVVPMVDLILGLPGDTPDDVRMGIRALVDSGLHDDSQVFPLSVLPGTVLRENALSMGLEFESLPPYHVVKTPTLATQELRELLAEAEETFGRRLDESPRPHLVEPSPLSALPDVFVVDLDAPSPAQLVQALRPGASHQSLWLASEDLFANRQQICDLIARRVEIDPYCTLDIVLRPKGFFPIDLLTLLKRQLAALCPSYGTRVLGWRGENALRRLSVCYPHGVACRPDLLRAMSSFAAVYQDQDLETAATFAAELGLLRPAARVLGEWPPNGESAWRTLVEKADVENVSFASRALEKRWTDEALGYAEI